MNISQSQSASPGRQSIGRLCDVALKKRSSQIALFTFSGPTLPHHGEAAKPIPIYFYPRPHCFDIALRQRFTGNMR
jgi:hypothetical protein